MYSALIRQERQDRPMSKLYIVWRQDVIRFFTGNGGRFNKRLDWIHLHFSHYYKVSCAGWLFASLSRSRRETVHFKNLLPAISLKIKFCIWEPKLPYIHPLRFALHCKLNYSKPKGPASAIRRVVQTSKLNLDGEDWKVSGWNCKGKS